MENEYELTKKKYCEYDLAEAIDNERKKWQKIIDEYKNKDKISKKILIKEINEKCPKFFL